MIKPTIHRNGTAQAVLLDQLTNAGHAVREAIKALAEAAPNARDYYLLGGDRAIITAQAEHAERAGKLESVLKDLQELAEHVADAESNR